MDYVIRNNRGVYIRLNTNGTPVTCTKEDRALFDYCKAKNIFKGLPKSMKKFHFKVEAVPNAIAPKEDIIEESVIKNDEYKIPDQVQRWIDKFGVCDEIINEARLRRKELREELSNVDKKITNLAHKIEASSSVNMYTAWQMVKEQKDAFNKRRAIKNEDMILSKILRMDFRNLTKANIDKEILRLKDRKFYLRIVEDDSDE